MTTENPTPWAKFNRRAFLSTLACAGASRLTSAWGGETPAAQTPGFHLFSKSFQWLDFDQLAEFAAAAGLQGIEYTVRPKGHIEPERVGTDLRRAVAAARKQGLTCKMMVTAITGSDTPYAENVLKTAADCGLSLYRTGYYYYDDKTVPDQQLETFKTQLGSLEKLNTRLSMTAGYQVHRTVGKRVFFGAVVWDLYAVLKTFDPQFFSCQYDLFHAFSETSGSWRTTLQLMAPYIRSLCHKDFLRHASQGIICCPAGEGIVPWKEYVARCKEWKTDQALKSIHCEHEILSKEEQNLPFAEKYKRALQRTQHEVNFFKGIWS
jgi:sugar phosphate isomerase/epimerase